jgi:RsiW-degrading membrane proteinase PrsW (M82 family)
LNVAVGLVLALLPVIVFLVALVLIDSYKLVPLQWIVGAILVGSVAALVCYRVNTELAARIDIGDRYTWYVSPLVEEFCKSLFIVFLIRARRIAFMVDALIYGFAIGAGFALVENVWYLGNHTDPRLAIWMVRGFGTAIMHGGVTAIMSIVSQAGSSRHGSSRFWVYVPGFLVAALLHGLFNTFMPAEWAPLVIIMVLTIIVASVFRVGERTTRDWLGVRFDTDQELLEMINTGKIAESRVGDYLKSLQERFPGEVVADMLCMLRIHLELSVRAKGMLLMKAAGFKTPRDPDIEERLTELKYLEDSIGKAGLLAISPILNMSDKELWQLHMLGKR